MVWRETPTAPARSPCDSPFRVRSARTVLRTCQVYLSPGKCQTGLTPDAGRADAAPARPPRSTAALGEDGGRAERAGAGGAAVERLAQHHRGAGAVAGDGDVVDEH